MSMPVALVGVGIVSDGIDNAVLSGVMGTDTAGDEKAGRSLSAAAGGSTPMPEYTLNNCLLIPAKLS